MCSRRQGHTEVCGDCGREFDDGLTDEDIKDGGEGAPQCELCGATLCGRCVRNHECSVDDLVDRLGD